MVNMAMSKEEVSEYNRDCCVASDAPDAPKYPWGLCIDLDDASLSKLGITELPAVGATMLIQAQVTVTRTSSSQEEGGELENRMSLQITDMEMSAPARDLAKALYPNQA